MDSSEIFNKPENNIETLEDGTVIETPPINQNLLNKKDKNLLDKNLLNKSLLNKKTVK